MSETAEPDPSSPPTWRDERAARWLAQSPLVEAQLAPLADLLLAEAGLGSGDRVLDVGCGTGPTTAAAAAAVGSAGEVTGLDISAALLQAAQARAVASGSAPIRWVEADVVRWEPDVEVDATISRFGVMFFDDPVAAFTTLRRATRPGGRLVAVTWAHRAQSPIWELPLQVALSRLVDLGVAVEPPPHDGGPFSLGSPEAVAATLGPAGWEDVHVEARPLDLAVGGGLDPRHAAATSLALGPAHLVVEEAGEAHRAAVAEAIEEAYADHVDPAGHVRLRATPLVVSARAPG